MGRMLFLSSVMLDGRDQSVLGKCPLYTLGRERWSIQERDVHTPMIEGRKEKIR